MSESTTKEVIKAIEEGKYKDIILDFDETVAHLIIEWKYFHVLMKEFALKYDVEEQRQEMNTHAFVEFIGDTFGEEAKDEIDTICEKVESEYLTDIVVNDELVVFITDNTEKYNFHILSNNMLKTLKSALKELNLEKYFVHILGRDSVVYPKPHPEGIEKIMKLQGGNKEDFIMIGDNPNSDIAAANRAGIASIIINMHL